MSTLFTPVAACWAAARAAGVVAPGPLVVGVSGGPDSLALLHVMRALAAREGIRLHVAHLDHGWRGAAGAADAAFVAATAAAWDLPCTVRAYDVPAYAARAGLSPEDAARRVRYAFLAGVAAVAGAGAVAVGHNADDQVETVVAHWLRGAGLPGLAGMASWAPLPPVDFGFWILDFGLDTGSACASRTDENDSGKTEAPKSKIQNPKFVLRPLLGVWRVEIAAYCAEFALAPREDATNADPAYRRNHLRHTLIPLLESEQPGFARRLWESAAVFHDEDALLDADLDAVWPDLAEAGTAYTAIRLARFAALPPALQRRALRRAAAGAAAGGVLGEITGVHIRAALALLGPQGRTGRSISWPGGLVVQRERARAVFSQDPRSAGNSAWPLLESGAVLPLPPTGAVQVGGFTLTIDGRPRPADIDAPAALDPWTAWFDAAGLGDAAKPGLILRTRRPGERIRPFGGGGQSRKLQDVLLDAGIPRPLRDRLALLAQADGEVLWVPGPGGRRSLHAPVRPDTRQVLRFTFTRNPQHAPPKQKE